MRRVDREVVGLLNILSILDKCDVIRLGLCVDNKPYIVPMNFAYEVVDDKVSLYLHSATEGRKMDMIAQNSKVCFEADCSYTTLKDDIACRWSAEYESVMGEGSITILVEKNQKVHALDVLMKRYGFEGNPQYDSHELSAVSVLCVSVSAITGKCKTTRS